MQLEGYEVYLESEKKRLREYGVKTKEKGDTESGVQVEAWVTSATEQVSPIYPSSPCHILIISCRPFGS
jgi:hypothetical protein